MMVLWLLMIRGISIEFRNHIESQAWCPIWDAGFAISSLLLAVFFGAALGNVVRGVPLDGSGDFFLPLWTNSCRSRARILDWYTILVALLAAATLTCMVPCGWSTRRKANLTSAPVVWRVGAGGW